MEMPTMQVLRGELSSVEAQIRQFSDLLNKEVGHGRMTLEMLRTQVALQATALEAQGKLLAYYGGLLEAFSQRLEKVEGC
jgi:hypothetical protein